MAQDGVNVTVLSNKVKGSKEDEIDHIRLLQLDHFTLAPFLNRKGFQEILARQEPDIVMWCGSPLSALSLARLKDIKKPLVWRIDIDPFSATDLTHISFKELIRRGHQFLWSQLLMLLCPRPVIKTIANSRIVSKIIAPSPSIGKWLANIGVQGGKVVVVPSTLDLDLLHRAKEELEFDESSRDMKNELGLSADSFLITYFGSPCTLRGTDTLVQSIPRILKIHDAVRLLILSRGAVDEDYFLSHAPEEDYLRRLAAKLKVTDQVRIVGGTLSRQRLLQFISASDVIALPFKMVFSQPPISILEAMSLGKVVIATNANGLSDIVTKDRGILVNPGDANAVAKAVCDLIEDPKWRVLLQSSARSFVSNLPSWDHITRYMIDLLSTICRDHVKQRINDALYRRLALKQRWQILKKNPLALYRTIRLIIVYKLFGLRSFNATQDASDSYLGTDRFGRDVMGGVLYYTELLKTRGLHVNTVVVLGSRVKGRYTSESDVDLLVVVDNLPKGRKKRKVLSDAPIFMNINTHGYTQEEIQAALKDCNMEVLDAMYYGLVVYDDGSWSEATSRFKEFAETYDLASIPNLKESLFIV